MSELERPNNPVRTVIITLAAVGCVGILTLAGLGFFMFYSCAQGM